MIVFLSFDGNIRRTGWGKRQIVQNGREKTEVFII